ncbi:hypothetical protein SRHO_G00068240 [Serrasalmus rhombeus]
MDRLASISACLQASDLMTIHRAVKFFEAALLVREHYDRNSPKTTFPILPRFLLHGCVANWRFSLLRPNGQKVDEREHPFDVENNNGTQFPRVTSKRVSHHPCQNLFFLLVPQQVIRSRRTQFPRVTSKRVSHHPRQNLFYLLVPQQVIRSGRTQFPRVTSKRVSHHPRQNLFYLLVPQQRTGKNTKSENSAQENYQLLQSGPVLFACSLASDQRSKKDTISESSAQENCLPLQSRPALSACSSASDKMRNSNPEKIAWVTPMSRQSEPLKDHSNNSSSGQVKHVHRKEEKLGK